MKCNLSASRAYSAAMTLLALITLASWSVWPVVVVVVHDSIGAGDESQFRLLERIAKLSMTWIDQIDGL
jgi:hypothetical protein